MTMIIDGTNGLTFPDNSRQYNGYFGFKNRIINGAMVIDQRNAGASVTPANDAYTLDRWKTIALQASKFTIQRNAGSVTPPAGFSNYLGVTSSSAYSVLSGDTFAVMQVIEGFNAADLAWGTASASPITISFWVRSSLTGVFGGSLWNGARGYVFTYSISAANTWEYKTVTIAGDTSGTYNTDSSLFTQVRFGLGSGASFSGTAGSWGTSNLVQPTGNTSVVGTNGATFYITGVQLEEGVVATNFDVRPYGTELQLCQRYCYKLASDATALYIRYATGFCNGTAGGNFMVPLKSTMRIAPSLTTTGTAANYAIYSGANAVTACSAVPTIGVDGTTTEVATVSAAVASGLTTGNGAILISNNTASSYLLLTAEL